MVQPAQLELIEFLKAGQKEYHNNMREYIMRGTYEAFVLVKIKDGSQYVCALNRQKKVVEADERMSTKDKLDFLATQVIWN